VKEHSLEHDCPVLGSIPNSPTYFSTVVQLNGGYMAVGLTTRHSVVCDKHGKQHPALGPEKVVFVSPPRHKRDQKTAGCPFCKAEKNS
jgi:hypothetical protein